MSIITLCTALLQEGGFTVLGADGSPEGLKICAQYPGPIDLLLVDLVLPPPGVSARLHGRFLVLSFCPTVDRRLLGKRIEAWDAIAGRLQDEGH